MADEAFKDLSSSRTEVGDSSESTIEINIKTLDSHVHKLRVNKDMPVLALKEKIVDVASVPVDQQRLIFRGRVLKDNHLLSEYHVEDGHTLHLVARQPVEGQTPAGTTSEERTRNNGSDPTSNAQHSRPGQVSHSVVVGTVNIADNAEGMVADIARGVGEILRSLGAGILAPTGGASNTSSATVPASVGTEAGQSNNDRAQPGNPMQPGFTILNHQFQVSPLSPPGVISGNMVIPDSLTTLSDFINRMGILLQNNGPQSYEAINIQHSPITSVRSSNRGIPTPEMLGSVIEQARQLLSGNTASTLSRIARRLEREVNSTDVAVRTQIQTEAMQAGMAMQHLGAMLLELGRTTLTLRMGQSPAESLVNAGPSVYISASGPNPIMVQPFPLQTSSLFGVSNNPAVSGILVPFGGGDPARNINIHIRPGTSSPSASSVDMDAVSGDSFQVDNANVQQTNQNANPSVDPSSMRVLPTRTVVAAIPARSPIEAASHSVSVISPVQLRGQSVTPGQPSSQGPYQTVSSGSQPNAAISLPPSFSGAGGIPAVVAQITARVANALSRNPAGQVLASQSTAAQGLHSSINNEARPSTTSPPQSFSLAIPSSFVPLTAGAQTGDVLPSSVDGRNSGNAASGSLPSSIGVLDLSNREADASNVGNCDVVQSHDPSASMRGGVQKQVQLKKNHSPNNGECSESAVDVELSTTSSSADKSAEIFIQSDQKMHASQTRQHGEIDRPAPLGLGLAGLQPKTQRRSKSAKPTVTGAVSRDSNLVDENQPAVARGQQVLQSIVSQSTDTNRTRAPGSSPPVCPPVGQATNGMSLGGQSPGRQIDFGNMLSHVLQSPALNSILTNVAQQTGVGSPAVLRDTMEQCSQSPAVRSTLNDIVQHLVGQGPDLGMFDDSAPGIGGIDFSRMFEQMMPVVSQVLGRGSMHPTAVTGTQSDSQLHLNDGRTSQAIINPQIDLRHACERIEQHDSPGNIFHAMLQGAGHLYGEDESIQDLVEDLRSDMEVANDYMNFLLEQIRQRLQ